ncbi:hypothetical protein M5K25_005736 [Dendrobium thyrsiflorum]|uniref:Uncharacterized protein n=1 Tax=Dendrobium thyrsiflorum TaxID=117978 RepID=A0ABD0VQX1_DENTH
MNQSIKPNLRLSYPFTLLPMLLAHAHYSNSCSLSHRTQPRLLSFILNSRPFPVSLLSMTPNDGVGSCSTTSLRERTEELIVPFVSLDFQATEMTSRLRVTEADHPSTSSTSGIKSMSSLSLPCLHLLRLLRLPGFDVRVCSEGLMSITAETDPFLGVKWVLIAFEQGNVGATVFHDIEGGLTYAKLRCPEALGFPLPCDLFHDDLNLWRANARKCAWKNTSCMSAGKRTSCARAQAMCNAQIGTTKLIDIVEKQGKASIHRDENLLEFFDC